MKMTVKTDGKKSTVKTFPAAHLCVVLVNFALGLASVAGVVLTIHHFGLDGYALKAALVVGSIIAMMVALAPALMAPAWVHAGWASKVAGIFVVSGFALLDAGFQANAVQKFELLGRTAQIQTVEARLATAQGKLDAVPTPDATGAIRRVETYTEVTTALRSDVKAAQADLKEARKPSFPVIWVLLAATLLQACSFFSRAWLTQVTNSMRKKEDATIAKAKTGKPKTNKSVITRAVNKALREHGVEPIKSVA